MQVSGTIDVKGELDIGAIFPSMFGLFGQMQGDVAARLAGVLAVSGSVSVNPPSLSGALELLAAVKGQLNTGGITFSFAVQADVEASLRLQLKLILGFLALLGGAKAEVFTYAGTFDSFGAACNGEVGGGIQGGLPADQCQALVFVTRYPAFMEALFKLVLA